MAAEGASEGWIHHNHVRSPNIVRTLFWLTQFLSLRQINWNCGGWGELDMTRRTIIEDCVMTCTQPNSALHGVIVRL